MDCAIETQQRWVVDDDGQHNDDSTAMDGNGRRDRDLKALDGMTAMDSGLMVLDSAAGRQWVVRWDVNRWRDGSSTAMDGAVAP